MRLEIIHDLLEGLQPDDIGDIEFLEQQLHQIDVIAIGLSLFVEEGIGC